MKKYRLLLALIAAIVLTPALWLAGCDSASTGGDATVRVFLTDFPLELVEEANVTIERVELIGEDGRVEVLADFAEPPTFNLLELQHGVTAQLSESVIPAGTYNQLRVVVGAEAEVLLVEDPNDPGARRRFDLKVPSGTETGIKINLPQLSIDTAGEIVDIVVDFHVEDSFVVLGNPATPAGIKGFIFKPVLRLERLEVNGAVIVE